MGKSQRTKGHNEERAVARDLREIYPDAKRGYQTRGGTAEAPDVDGTPWFWECKVGQRPNPRRALLQATAATDGRVPVASTKVDRQPRMVSLWYDDWLVICRELERLSVLDTEHYKGEE